MTTKNARPKSQLRSELLLEKKIQECQQRISESQQTIEVLRSQQDGMCASDIIDISVEHKLFGTGIITEQNATSITVSFTSGSKRFVMPSAFLDGFLKTEDASINERLSEYLSMQQKIQEAKDAISASNRAIFALETKNIPISAKKACRTPLWNPAGFAVCPPGAALYAALIRACFSDHHPQSIAVYKKVFEISDDISYNNQVRYVQAVF